MKDSNRSESDIEVIKQLNLKIKEKKIAQIFKKVAGIRELALILFIIVIGIIVSILSPYFLTFSNINTLLLGVSLNAILAFGMTMLLIAGYFDLTVGSVSGLAAGVTAVLMTKLDNPIPVWLAILIGLLIGVVIGIINGFAIVKMGLNSFIFTFGGLVFFRSVLFIITKGSSIARLPASFNSISQTKYLGIQLPVYVMIVFLIVGDILVRKSVWGKKIFYIGLNSKSAKLAGIRVENYSIALFSLSGFLAAFSGMLLTSRIGTATVSAGTGLEFEVITAAVVGGASLFGGKGSILGSFLGAMLMGLVLNSMALLDINIYWQNIVVGIVLIMFVVIDAIYEKRKILIS